MAKQPTAEGGSACSLALPRLSWRPPPSPAISDFPGSAHRDGQRQDDLKCAPDRPPSGLLKSVHPTDNHERDEKEKGRQFVPHLAFLALPGVCRNNCRSLPSPPDPARTGAWYGVRPMSQGRLRGIEQGGGPHCSEARGGGGTEARRRSRAGRHTKKEPTGPSLKPGNPGPGRTGLLAERAAGSSRTGDDGKDAVAGSSSEENAGPARRQHH